MSEKDMSMPEPVAYLYTLEYGETVAGRRLSEHQLKYPFGVCGSDYLMQNDDGVSYVRQIPLYTKDIDAAGYAQRNEDVFHDVTVALRALLDMPDNENTKRHARVLLRRAEAALRGEVKP